MSFPRPELFYSQKLTRGLTQGGSETKVYVDTLPTETNGFMVISPQSSSRRELIKYTGTSASGGNHLTGAVRGIAFAHAPGSAASESAVTANAKRHNAGEPIEMVPGHVEIKIADILSNDAPMDNELDMGSNKVTDLAAPTADLDAATKKYVDDASAGGQLANASIVAEGKAGETVTSGQLIYLNTTDNEWKLSDATDTSTVDVVLLGIAQGAGTNGNDITNGVLLFGLDLTQTGMTQGDVMFATDVAGTIGSSAGTLEVAVGIAEDTTKLYFAPRYNRVFSETDWDLIAGLSLSVKDVTASAAELNQMNGATITASQLTEAGTFFGATNIIGSEAETLTDGSEGSSLHHHEPYLNIVRQLTSNVLTFIGGDNDGLSEVANGTGSVARDMLNTTLEVDTSGDDAALNDAGDRPYQKNDGGSAVWSDLPQFKFAMSLKFNATTTQDFFLGFDDGGNMSAAPANAIRTNRHVAWMVDDGTLYASVADGTTQNRTSEAITLTDFNLLEFEMTGSSAIFKINGTTIATLETNYPTSGGNGPSFNCILTGNATADRHVLIRHPFVMSLDNVV